MAWLVQCKGGGQETRNLFLIFPTIHKGVVMSLKRTGMCSWACTVWKGTDARNWWALFLKNG